MKLFEFFLEFIANLLSFFSSDSDKKSKQGKKPKAKLVSRSKLQMDNVKRCKNCSNIIQEDWKVCLKCGTVINSDEQE